jgi:hypothetical protein
MRSLANVEDNAAVAEAPPPTAEELALLAEHRWQKSFYS